MMLVFEKSPTHRRLAPKTSELRIGTKPAGPDSQVIVRRLHTPVVHDALVHGANPVIGDPALKAA